MVLGRWTAGLRHPWWYVGYLVPLPVVVIIALAAWYEPFGLWAPVSWLTRGRTEYVYLALAIPTMLTLMTLRQPKSRQRVLAGVLMGLAVLKLAIFPFLMPALVQGRLAAMKTRLDENGVCLQGTGYTCGPASAVTALRRLGLPAEEGELAVLARTAPTEGTPPDMLCQAIETRYADDGVQCEYRLFSSIDELRGRTPVLALTRINFLLGHYMTVLRVTDSDVVVGDPLFGVLYFAVFGNFQGLWFSDQSQPRHERSDRTLPNRIGRRSAQW